jgi:signal transduction histidine kinase
LGLLSMQERLRLLKGFLHIHSRPGDGARICGWIPLAEAKP